MIRITPIKVVSLFILGLLSFQSFGDMTGKKETIYIEADTIDYDYNKRIVNYNGHVRAFQGLTVLVADRMVVNYNKNNKIEQVTALGSIDKAVYKTMVNDDKDLLVASAKTIHYFPITGKVRLEEDATVSYNQNQFAGPYIIYDTNKKLISSDPKKNSQSKIILEPIKDLKTHFEKK